MNRANWLAVLALVVGVGIAPAQSATINVAAGEVAVSLGNGKCSLREAILNAEAGGDTSGGDCVAGSAGSDIIALAAGSTYVLSDQDPNHLDNEVNGLPEIHNQVTIDGNGATIQRDAALFSGTACGGAGAKFRIFYVSTLGTLTLTNLTLANGCANVLGLYGAGGAIFNRGNVTLDSVTLKDNQALRSGGAIHNDGNLVLSQSTVSGNAVVAAEAGGGGIVNRGAMQVLQSTISGNHGAGAGGGVDTGLGNATFANTTVSGNVAEQDGGGIFSRSPSTVVVNSTIMSNRGTNAAAAGPGSGVFVAAGTLTLANSLLAQQANGANCAGVSGGGNNLADDATCPTAAVSASPGVGPLANNGGPTLTHALLLGSPAIDAANTALCSASPVDGVDQRDTPRPQGAACDIGAYEIAQYSVTYDGNGNTGGSVPTGGAYPAGSAVTVAANTGGLVKAGSIFAGWNTKADGSGITYAATGSATFVIGAGNVTLYALWTAVPVYSVVYNGNGNTGGSVPAGGTYPAGATVTVAANTGGLVKTGSNFVGWNTQPDGGGTSYAATGSATFVMGASNVTLYAQWSLVTVTGPGATGLGTITAGITGGGASCGFTTQQFIPLSGGAASPPTGSAPAGVSFPEGLFNLALAGCTPGSTISFTLTYPQPLPSGTQYWNYGPTSTNTSPHWYVLPAVVSGNVITFTITDGGVGDNDFALGANGSISAVGGPGVALRQLLTPAAGISTLSQWSLALLCGLLLVAGMVGLRRRS